MQIIDRCEKKSAMALGNFDGLHKAHMEIINSCVEYARKNSLLSGVLLFDRHTSEVFGGTVGILTTMEEKLRILEGSGIDFVHIMHFDKETAGVEPEAFIDRISNDFSVDAFFVGYDYTFGKGAKGTTKILKELGEKEGFKTVVTDCVRLNDTVVSSTTVREAISEGDMERAEVLLGRRYFILGNVVKGFGNGTKFLYPTANVEIKENKFLPPDGVYKAVAVVDGKKYRSAVNIGKNPTFDAKKRTVESFLLDFEGELYGKEIKVEFLERIRPERKFQNTEELKKQIEKDIKKAYDIKI